MRPGQFIPFETLLLDARAELWRILGPTALLTYLAHRAAHQQFTSAEGRRGREAREMKRRQSYFESEENLGRRVGLSESSVKRGNALLRSVGLLERVQRGAKGKANHYRLPPVTLFLLAEATKRVRVLRQGVHSDAERGSQRTPVGVRLNPSGGHSDRLSLRSEIEKANGEVKSRGHLSFGKDQEPPSVSKDGPPSVDGQRDVGGLIRGLAGAKDLNRALKG